MPIASVAVTARWGTRRRTKARGTSRAGRPTRTASCGRSAAAWSGMKVFAGAVRQAGAEANVAELAPVPARTVRTPAEPRILAMARPILRSPSISTTAAWRRARYPAPPVGSACAIDAVASSDASLARNGESSPCMAAAAKSSITPPAASKVRIRSVVATGMPWRAAAAITSSRLLLPSSRPISSALYLMPDNAIARLGSMPICSVSRSRQTGSKPALSAGLMDRTLPSGYDSQAPLAREGKPGRRPGEVGGVKGENPLGRHGEDAVRGGVNHIQAIGGPVFGVLCVEHGPQLAGVGDPLGPAL